MRREILAAALLLGAAAARAEEPAAPRTLTVTVLDEKSGAAVQGLQPSDVVVMEDGVAREVTALAAEERPLTVAVLVDTSGPVASPFRLNVLPAVLKFLGSLPEGTRYALWVTGDRPRKVVDYTDNVLSASRALRKVFPQGGNRLLDGLVEASRDLREKEGQRTAVVAVTGAGVGFTDIDRFAVVSESKKGGHAFYGVLFDEATPEAASGEGQVGRTDYEYALARLAEETGGHFARLLTAMALPRGLSEVTGHLAGQYRVTFLGLPGGKDRKVEVRVARPGVKVRIGTGRSS